MQIKNLKIKNFKSIENQSIEFLPNINIFVGVNGAGKTTILEVISISLSWLINRIQKENSSGKKIKNTFIRNESKKCKIEIGICFENNIYNWSLIQSAKGYSSEEHSELSDVSKLAYIFQEEYQKNSKLPMIAYYPVNRIAEGISNINTSISSISNIDIYSNSLGEKANFSSFFEWFKIQDDILNEQSMSITKWMIKHKKWIQKRVLKIINSYNINENNEAFEYFIERVNYDDSIYEEPVYIFRELIHVLEEQNYTMYQELHLNHIMHETEYLLYKMSKSSFKFKKFISVTDFPFHHIKRVYDTIIKTIYSKHDRYNKIHFAFIKLIWSILNFAVLLGCWWLSTIGIRQLEKLFKKYEPLYTDNINDYSSNSQAFIEEFINIINNDTKRLENATFGQGRELQQVAKAIERFIPEYTNIRVTRIPKPHMLVNKNGTTFRLDQLSDGEKNMIAMIGDIARRLSISNPDLEEPLHGYGIILIDEIDLHLHPLWQRTIITNLVKVFPNCQFIITTHSPQVISHVKAEHIFLLTQKNNRMQISKAIESYGQSTNRLLEDILDVDSRPTEIKAELKKLYDLISDNKLDEAKKLMNVLEKTIEGREPELVKANVLIKRREVLGK